MPFPAQAGVVAPPGPEPSADRSRMIADNTTDAVYQVDMDGAIEWISPSVTQLLGWDPEDLRGVVALDLVHPNDALTLRRNRSRVLTGSDVDGVVGRFRTSLGTYRSVTLRARPVLDPDGRQVGAVVTLHDSHDKAAAERALTTLSRGNGVLVRAVEEQELLEQMCRTVVDAGHYLFAWYGRPDAGHDRWVDAVAVAGAHGGYVDAIRVSWGDGPAGKGPTGIAIRTRTTQVRDSFDDDPDYAPWTQAAREHGFRSSISLPVVVDGAIDGALMVYAADTGAFDPVAQSLLEDLANDLGYGLARLRDAQRLAEALHSSVFLLAAAVESRDPYTAGHQADVGVLCEAIGHELGMDDVRLRGLVLGASIHDVGKIAIDQSILAKEGPLTDAEWVILKDHSAVGYRIAGQFPWPWPIAEMIYQHHERLDGSGYPRQLRGEEILLEARIIAVADTYDAMVHDRPYRTAPGDAAARAVLAEGRGVQYDAAVIDAFERVMAAGFQFET